MNNFFKKIVAVLFMSCLITTFVLASGSQESKAKKVSFWYLWGGAEGEIIEEIISEFNASQSEYFVEGLSVPDTQKIVTAISSGSGPDVTDNFSNNVASYAEKLMVEPLDRFISSEKFDLTVFDKSALETNQYKGVTYGLPLSINVFAMFCNMDLLNAAGYTEPPKTMQELEEMSYALTKKDSSGDIEVLGFPLVPLTSYPIDASYAFGGSFISNDKKILTPDNKGTLAALHLNSDYRGKVGRDVVNKFVSTAQNNRYTPQDVFFNGQQAIRFDGPWLVGMADKYSPDMNYVIAPIPYTEEMPELYGVTRMETSNMFIPTTAKEKQGAWEFIKYITVGRGSEIYITRKGDIPSTTSMMNDSKILSMPGFSEFIHIIFLGNNFVFPAFAEQVKYQSLMNEQFDYVYNGTKTPEQAMLDVKKLSDKLL